MAGLHGPRTRNDGVQLVLCQQDHRGEPHRRRTRRMAHRPACHGELLRGDRGASRVRPWLSTGRGRRSWRASDHRHQLSALAGSICRKPTRDRIDDQLQRRPAYHHWRHAGRLPRYVRRLCDAVLGAGLSAGGVRPFGVQARRSRRAMDRGIRSAQTRRHDRAGSGANGRGGAATRS